MKFRKHKVSLELGDGKYGPGVPGLNNAITAEGKGVPRCWKNSLGIPDGEVEDLGSGYLFMDSIMPNLRGTRRGCEICTCVEWWEQNNIEACLLLRDFKKKKKKENCWCTSSKLTFSEERHEANASTLMSLTYSLALKNQTECSNPTTKQDNLIPGWGLGI